MRNRQYPVNLTIENMEFIARVMDACTHAVDGHDIRGKFAPSDTKTMRSMSRYFMACTRQTERHEKEDADYENLIRALSGEPS